MRIYLRRNGGNTIQQTLNNIYSFNTWVTVKITRNNGNISISINGQSIAYPINSSSYFKSFTSNSTTWQLSQFLVKAL